MKPAFFICEAAFTNQERGFLPEGVKKMSKLDPLSLKLYISVVTEKSIAAAALRHHIAATAVSKRISDLEESLNTVLLHRTNRGVEPTDAGNALFSLAQSALNELEGIPLLMRNFCSGGQGIVRICASTSAVAQFLTEDLLSFLKVNPGIQFHIDERTSDTVLQAVRDNAVDIGVFTNAIAPEGVCSIPYGEDRLVLICPTGHPLSERDSWRFEQTLDHDFISWYGGSAINKQLNTAALMTQSQWRLRMRVSSFDTLCRMVSEGIGVGILPAFAAQQRSKVFPIKVCQLEDEWAVRKFRIAYRDKASLGAAAKSLLDFFLNQDFVRTR
ncbi:LysR family transcriptional regulator [Zwartia sp. IMCC34845]|nr:LysR family transcriptional regulator [Zwartia vadi]